MQFNIDKLAAKLDQRCPEVVFALLHGSARDGHVRPGGDVDIALFVEGRVELELYARVMKVVEEVAPGAEADVGILNHAEPVYLFEALKGRLLFCRDMDRYVHFFSLTCREYESQMASYRRQQTYRLEAQAV
jgi:uncharacterized protein